MTQALVSGASEFVGKILVERQVNGGFPAGVKKGEDVIDWTNLVLKNTVVHGAFLTAVYNQDAENRSEVVREKDPPESLLNLSRLVKTEQLRSQDQLGVQLLFDNIAVVTSAGLLIKGEKKSAKKILLLAKKLGRLKVVFL